MLLWIFWYCNLLVPQSAKESVEPQLLVTPYITFIDTAGQTRELPLNATVLMDWNDSVVHAEFKPAIPGDSIKGYFSYAPGRGDAVIDRYTNSAELTRAFQRVRSIPNRKSGDHIFLWKLSFVNSTEKISKITHFL